MNTRETLPARLRQATDNYELLPIVSFDEWVRRIQVLCNEAADALNPRENPSVNLTEPAASGIKGEIP